VRLLTWNILHGGGPERLPRIALALLDWAPDVITLTEFRAARGGSLRAVLADHGWEHQAVSGGHDPDSDPAPPSPNRVLIASRRPIDAVDAHPGLPPALRRRILTARLRSGPRSGLEVTAVHVPEAARSDRAGLVAKTAVWHELLRAARARRDADHVILGDLNTGRHRLDEAGASFSCTALLGRLASLGYADAWRTLHGAARQGSWFSPAGGAFRIDHALVSPPLAPRVTHAEYGLSALAEGLSDHAPLVVGLAPGPAEAGNHGEFCAGTSKNPPKIGENGRGGR